MSCRIYIRGDTAMFLYLDSDLDIDLDFSFGSRELGCQSGGN